MLKLKMPKAFYKCRCFYTRNIYSKILNSHVVFENETKFRQDYKQALENLDKGRIKDVIEEIQNEVARRRSIDDDHLKKGRLIKQHYIPLIPSLYTLSEEFLRKEFLDLVSAAASAKHKKDVFSFLYILSEGKELYSFPVFTEKFCNDLMQELENFEKSTLPKGRPNSMNHYGVLLDELGFCKGFLDVFREQYLNPLAKLLYPDWCGDSLDSHRAFTVTYSMEKDLELDMHFDNAEVTVNICLGKSCSGGELYFGEMRTVPVTDPLYVRVPHVIGHGVFHRGQQLHGALPISSGERHNMIIWMRSSSVRSRKCPMCDSKLELIPSVDYGDGFVENQECEKRNGMFSLCSLL